MDARPRAWLLNFDAEAELADPSARTPPAAVAARSRALTERVRALLGPDDVVVSNERLLRGAFRGRAWCPTPGALAALARAGADLPRAPPFDVIRRVNHRRFCADLGQTLPGARYVTTRADLDATIARSGPWILKRPFGFAGRGRLRVSIDRLDAAAERWIDASLAAGEGLEVEPWVTRAGDFALHGFLSEAGDLVLGEPTSQRCDDAGAWIASERARDGELSADEVAALEGAAREAAAALVEAGYFGPFGIDAFRWLDAGAPRFNPRCEINARYSMGWAAGMGTRRPDLG